IAVMNDQGKVVAATKDGLTGTVLADHPLFTGTRSGKESRVPLGVVPFAQARGLSFAAPIRASYDANTVIGVLVGVVDWKFPQQQIAHLDVFGATQGPERHAALVSQSGEVLHTFQGVDPALIAPLEREAGSRSVVLDGVPTMVATAVDPEYGWVFHQIVTADIAYQPVIELGNQSMLLGLILVPLVGAVGAFAAQHFVRPILAITGGMNRLAQGDMEIDLTLARRRDEIGAMGRAVEVFRDNAVRVAHLQTEQERLKLEAETQRKKSLRDLAGSFEASVKGIVCIVSSSSTELESSAESLSRIASQTVERSAAANEAAERASVSAQSVNASAEELTASISEINLQVARSSEVVKAVASEATHADSTVKSLTSTVARIDDIAKLITEIAGQTNLLALNATIEAARAGDAGKGFTIVAQEVKNLANRTASATEEIISQIAAVQSATGDTVQAIRAITAKIAEINEIVAVISSAIHEEEAATREIACNIDHAVTETMVVTGELGAVQASSVETGTASTHVLEAARELSVQAETLRGDVDAFIAHIYQM
ncbi:MAG: methyl-accepting chemotaxis protein, partial [Alphaproteobacteria bacterium]